MKLERKKILEEVQKVGLSNVDAALQGAKEEGIDVIADMPVTMGDNYADSKKRTKYFAQAIDANREVAEETKAPDNEPKAVPENSIYTKQLVLEESLFEDVDPNKGLLPDFVDQKPGFDEWEPEFAEKFLGKYVKQDFDKDEVIGLSAALITDLTHNCSNIDVKNPKAPGPKGYQATADRELQDRDSNIRAFNDGIAVLGKDARDLDKAKKIAMRYYDFGVFYSMEDYEDKQGYYTKILYIYCPDFDDVEREESDLFQKIDTVRERMDESLKLITDIDLDTYSSNEQGQETLDKIKEAGALPKLSALLEEMYPDGVNRETLDDLLWFESDWLFEMLGISAE